MNLINFVIIIALFLLVQVYLGRLKLGEYALLLVVIVLLVIVWKTMEYYVFNELENGNTISFIIFIILASVAGLRSRMLKYSKKE